MPQLNLNDAEMTALMNVLANAEGKGVTWAVVNPLLLTIGNQLRAQHEAAQMAAMRDAQRPPTNSKFPEVRDEPTHYEPTH